MTKPWDRLPKEPILWFHRFELYRSLGPNRTFEEACRLATKLESEDEQSETKRPNPSWYDTAKQWQWKERVEAFDMEGISRMRKKEEAEREKAHQQRLAAYRGLLGRGWERVQMGLESESVAVHAVDLGAKGLRTEFGEAETIQKVEIGFEEPLSMKELMEGLDDETQETK